MDLFNDLFNEIWNDFGAFGATINTTGEKRCPVCGHTIYDFKRTGKLGCGECYKAFRPFMKETLRQIHSTSTHNGKIPSKSGEELRRRRQLEALRAQLKDAVKNENYEEAAKIHKQIKETEE